MEKPILFNTDMVKAILDGIKTQTRRIVKQQPPNNFKWFGWVLDSTDNKNIGCATWIDEKEIPHHAKPPYQVGDILWIRETWGYYEPEYVEAPWFVYKADFPIIQDGVQWDEPKWKPSIHMPREVARIFLKVTSIRVERLHDITEEDARLEGVSWLDDACYYNNGWQPTYNDPDSGGFPIFKDGFRALWDGIYKNWDENPWVWVIEFERVEGLV